MEAVYVKGLYKAVALYTVGAIFQPIVKVAACALVQMIFYKGTSVTWYPKHDVNYANSCDEKSLLPWLHDDVKISYRSLPGQMKISFEAVAFLEKAARCWISFTPC